MAFPSKAWGGLALRAIRAEWTNPRHDHEMHAANLRGHSASQHFGAWLNRDFSLVCDGEGPLACASGFYWRALSVFDDDALDVLFGGPDRDWFFANRSSDWVIAMRRDERAN